MDLTTVGMLVAGLVLLVAGGELLVRGASSLAAIARISPLVIGLTVVSFGTSAPELAVSVQAGLGGSPDIAMGNVVGSNIFNVLFILGVCALIGPLIVTVQLVRREVPIMIGVSALLLVLALDGRISLLDGLLLSGSLVAYLSWSIISSRKETAAAQAEFAQEYGQAPGAAKKGAGYILAQLSFVLGGLALLVIGAGWLVDGSVTLARTLGVSDVIIGLTIVAAGTSLPEVVTSIIATLKRERDIAIGNVVGSNIFNILGILGISSLVTPGGLSVAPSVLAFDLPVMIAVALACLPIFFTGLRIARWEGSLFLGYYVAYTAFLVLGATQHDALPIFSGVMGLFVLPLTAITLVVLVVQAFYRQRRDGASAAG